MTRRLFSPERMTHEMLTLTLTLLLAFNSRSAYEPPQDGGTQTEAEAQVYEDPAACLCYYDEATGRTICNSACSGRVK